MTIPEDRRIVIDCPDCKRVVWAGYPCPTCQARRAAAEAEQAEREAKPKSYRKRGR